MKAILNELQQWRNVQLGGYIHSKTTMMKFLEQPVLVITHSMHYEEIMCMEELFTMPTIPQHHSYPVIVTSSTNGFMLNSGEFVVMINC
jgi:hypothetical protein